jgi:uncharacterized protein (DUF4415 family)
MSKDLVLDDDDASELTEERLARLRPAREVLPESVLAQFKRSPGRPKAAQTKTHVSVRLSSRVIDHFKAGGAEGWQTRLNAALEEIVDAKSGR